MGRWEQIESIYQSAVEREEHQRAAFLEEACGADAELRREVESLLACNPSAQGFMGKTALEVAAMKLAADRAPLLVGRQFGNYKIVSLIGAGGMGVVYRATDTRLDRTVAVKVLHSHLSGRLVWRQRFEREARTISKLNHAHICSLYDIGQEGEANFLVMEYLEGETLGQRLKRGPLATEQGLDYACEIAEALDQAHRHGVVHRDLKPSNIMLTRTGTKLLDFGLAKQTDEMRQPASVPDPVAHGDSNRSENITEEGTILGTLEYMAPEQVEGKEADTRTDIFALGVVTYEMVTGRKAFAGTSKASLAASILSSYPPPIRSIQPSVPLALEHVVQRCLAKDPDERWQSARDLALELKWIAAGPSPVPSDKATEEPQHKRTWLASVVVLMLLAASWAGWFISRHYFPQAGIETSPIRFRIPPQNAKLFPVPVISPDGQKLAICEGSTLWIRPLKSAQPYSLTTSKEIAGDASMGQLFWSADSRYVAFWQKSDNRATLKKIEVSGGAPATICETVVPGGSFGYGTWSRDGIILFERGEEPKGISRVAAEGGTPVAVTTLDSSRDETDHILPRFLPDGRHFLYSVLSKKAGQSGIYIGSLDSSVSKQLIEYYPAPSTMDKYFVYAASGYLLYKRQGQLLARPFDTNQLRFSAEPRALEDQPARLFDPSVSDHGDLCYNVWAANPTAQVTKFDRRGKQVQQVSAAGGFGDLDLSPDGTRLALEEALWDKPHNDIWTLDLRRGIKTHLTMGGLTMFYWCPRWSPDGSQILYNSVNSPESGSGDGDLCLKASTGEGPETAILKSPGMKFLLDWSRDGRYVLYLSPPGVWAVPLFGERRPFVFEPSASQAKFSPDGRWVAYADLGQSEDPVNAILYVRSFSSSERKYRISPGHGYAPRWRADGKELFYWTDDRKLVSVETKVGEDFRLGPARVLFESRQVDPHAEGNRQTYVVSPDGQYFYMLVDQSPPVINVQIVLNGLAPRK
jgi:serine/threonine protein kinase/dipeptidyl aminopeptidase/acylaminoacyl peptidase